MLNIFESSNLLGEMAEVKHGLSTGKNEAVVRFWPEISWSEFGRGFESRSEALVSKYKWFPYNKGGDYRKWYGNCEYVLRYDEYGNSLMASFSGHRHDGKSHYFREGVTWTFISKWLCKSYRVTFSVIITYVFDRFTELVERTVGCQR